MTSPESAQHGSVCPWWLMYFADYRLRGLFQPTAPVIDRHVAAGDRCLDMGCGMGYFTVPMAHRVGAAGSIMAVDIQQKMLDGMTRRAAREGVAGRISACLAGDGAWRSSGGFDFMLAFWMLHEVPDRESLLKELRRLLNPEGRFLLVEPRIHVGRRDWELSVRLAHEAGLHLVEQPRVRYSRAALFSTTDR